MATAAATGTSSHASRESRRRRILERRTDRLALITGKIQSLPLDPYQSRIHSDSAQHDDVAPGPALPSSDSRLSSRELSEHQVFEEEGAPLTLNCDKGKSILCTETSESSPLDHDQGRSISSREKGETLTLSSDKIISSRAAASHGREERSSQISSTTRRTTQDHQCANGLLNSHTIGQFRSAIAATENLRMWFSTAAAILVILSHAGFPILGSPSIRSIILLRPLYLLLLTNISIVLARVVPQGATGQPSQSSAVSRSAQIGRAIDVCLLLQKISTALLIDIGIYAIVIISGLSLIQKLGW